MKKFVTIFLSSLLLLALNLFTGCEKSSDSEYSVIQIDVLSPVENDSLTVGDSITVISKLTGFTFEYSKVNYYFGNSTTPAAVYTKEMINALNADQEKDAQFEYTISTNGLDSGIVDLTVEAVGNNLATSTVIIPLRANLPGSDDSSLDLVINSPANGTEFRIGDRITVEVGIEGNLTLFLNFTASLNNSAEPVFESNLVEATKTFDVVTEDFAAGSYRLQVDLELKTEEIKTKYLDFTLVEYIPTFEALGTADGYQLKSMIQTYDNGYLAVSSYSPTPTTGGTRVIKYDMEGAVQWTQNIPAAIGFAESICEDTEYDKGYILAGWRYNGTDKDTWVRKIDQTNGNLIWNKTYDYDLFKDGVDDGATVIKKSVDDGYIIGGYSLNPYGTDSLIFSYGEGEGAGIVRTTWETGYDVRLLKIYSNGNEIWGDSFWYTTHRMWHDITLHKDDKGMWVRKMGDQMITDLVAKEDGNYLVTGWNNWYLYPDKGSGTYLKDMFFAEFDNFGSYVSTMTWSIMNAYDESNMAGEDDPYGLILNTSVISANQLGDYTEEEIGYGLVESQGGFGGQVVMAGETHQTDSKARLYDGWVVEFGINMDEDGALWEYSFGETARDDKAYGISKTKDGGYIVTGYKTATDKNTWLYKLDAQLSLLWEKELGVAGDDVGVKVLQTTDGGFMIGGNVGAGATARAKLMKVNKTGDSAK